MPYLYAPTEFNFPAASRAAVPGGDYPQVTEEIHFKVPFDIDISKVQVLPVSPGNEVTHPFQCVVSHNLYIQAHRTCKAHRRTRNFFNHTFRGQFNCFCS